MTVSNLNIQCIVERHCCDVVDTSYLKLTVKLGNPKPVVMCLSTLYVQHTSILSSPSEHKVTMRKRISSSDAKTRIRKGWDSRESFVAYKRTQPLNTTKHQLRKLIYLLFKHLTFTTLLFYLLSHKVSTLELIFE